jgi:hypothetical protein
LTGLESAEVSVDSIELGRGKREFYRGWGLRRGGHVGEEVVEVVEEVVVGVLWGEIDRL